MTNAHRLLVLLAIAASARSIAAQGAAVSYVGLIADHELLGDPLSGVAVTFRVPQAGWVLRLGAEHVRGHAERTGIPCAGLIPPTGCEPETMRDHARLTTVFGGIVIEALTRRHLAVDFAIALRIGQIEATSRGLTSGGTLVARKVLWGGDLGLDAAWTPISRLPLALELGAAVGGLTNIVTEQVVDGYRPFDNGLAAVRLAAGVAWRL